MLYGEYPFNTKNGINSLYDVILKCNIRWDSTDVSPQAKALMKRMLVVDVQKRYIIFHPLNATASNNAKTLLRRLL
jgi:serine/threonine protein kinase